VPPEEAVAGLEQRNGGFRTAPPSFLSFLPSWLIGRRFDRACVLEYSSADLFRRDAEKVGHAQDVVNRRPRDPAELPPLDRSGLDSYELTSARSRVSRR